MGSDIGLSPGRCQAIIWTNTGILLIRPLRTTFNEIFIKICTLIHWFIDALIQIMMAWRHPGDKPLSEPMEVRLLMHICVTQPQWVKYVKNWNLISLVIFTCHIFSSYSFWAISFIIVWFSLIFHCLKAGFVTCPEDKLIVYVFTTRDCEYCWWFQLWGACCIYFGGNRQIDAIKTLEVILTHWGCDKMAAIFQTTFSNAFSWMKI